MFRRWQRSRWFNAAFLVVQKEEVSSLEVEIIGGNGLYGQNRFRSRHWDQILDDLVYNAEDIPEVDYAKLAHNRKDVTGCEYLIVVPDQADFITWADSIKLFRTEQGIHTEIVTITDIGGNTVYMSWTRITRCMTIQSYIMQMLCDRPI